MGYVNRISLWDSISGQSSASRPDAGLHALKEGRGIARRTWLTRNSGYPRGRSFDQLISDHEAGIEIVVRDLWCQFDLRWMLQRDGIELKVLTQQIDTTTAMGKLIFYIFGALAEMERDLISERTKAGLASARARGAILGRGAIMTPDKEEKAVELLASGMPVEKMAERLKVSRSKLYAWRKAYREQLEGESVSALDNADEVSK